VGNEAGMLLLSQSLLPALSPLIQVKMFTPWCQQFSILM
jgi:hypothetical protein